MSASSSAAAHWDAVYAAKQPEQMSWTRPTYATSLRLIAPVPGAVVDVGSGVGALVDELLAAGRDDVTVLDVSAEALERVRARVSPLAAQRQAHVETVVSDVLAWRPDRPRAVWHDRAVFHFLTDPAHQQAYAALTATAVLPGGCVVLGCFAPDGPEACSGLPVSRWSADALADHFGEHGFSLEHSEREVHTTPWAADQPFTWVRLRRDG